MFKQPLFVKYSIFFFGLSVQRWHDQNRELARKLHSLLIYVLFTVESWDLFLGLYRWTIFVPVKHLFSPFWSFNVAMACRPWIFRAGTAYHIHIDRPKFTVLPFHLIAEQIHTGVENNIFRVSVLQMHCGSIVHYQSNSNTSFRGDAKSNQRQRREPEERGSN